MSNRQLTPDALMAKADTACSSARALLDLGDVDGAANRAYYAIQAGSFDHPGDGRYGAGASVACAGAGASKILHTSFPQADQKAAAMSMAVLSLW